MKTKDVGYLALAIVLFAVAGVLAYSQLSPKKSSSGVTVEVVEPIASGFDQGALDVLSDPSKTRNFTPAIDLTGGLGNSKPFNSL